MSMKKIFFLILACITLSLHSQIKTVNIGEKKKEIIPYDSLKNIDGYTKDRHIGQTLYLMPTKENEAKQIQFYSSFETFEKYGNYESLKGKYFSLVDIVNGSRVQDVYMQLIETETQDTVYYPAYLSSDTEPFLTVGYFEKLQSQITGKKFVYKENEIRPNPMRSLEDRKPIRNIPNGSVFVAIDISVDELYGGRDIYSYNSPPSPLIVILKNEEYGQVFVSHEEIKKSFNVHETFRHFITYTEHEAQLKENKEHRDLILKKFGANKGKLILENKVRIGFTAEMCRYSWGDPIDINKTTGSYGIHEQWVYDGSYLYFENGILTTIQN